MYPCSRKYTSRRFACLQGRPSWAGRQSPESAPVIFLHYRERGCKSAAATCKLISMPELPDIAAYITALEQRIVAQPLIRVRLASPFLLRTAQPPIKSVVGRVVRERRRVCKRITIVVHGNLWPVLHLIIA